MAGLLQARHLLVETPRPNLGETMKWLQQSYSAWFNRREGRVGPLWQGRFKAVVLDWEEAGLETSRYIYLNPMRVRGLGLSKAQRAQRSAAGHEAPMDEMMKLHPAALV